jgi:hypothetical protein
LISLKAGLDDNNFQVQKSFFIPRYFRATWVNAALICNLYQMELASLDTSEQMESVRGMLLTHSHLLTEWTHINAMTLTGGSTADWYWVSSEKKVSYNMIFSPNEPNHYQNRQWCMALGPKTNNIFRFDDIDCFQYHEEKFLCQVIDSIESA